MGNVVKQYDLHAWSAFAEPYEPLCIGSQNGEGFSLALYVRDGVILGGSAYDSETETTTHFGLVDSSRLLL